MFESWENALFAVCGRHAERYTALDTSPINVGELWEVIIPKRKTKTRYGSGGYGVDP